MADSSAPEKMEKRLAAVVLLALSPLLAAGQSVPRFTDEEVRGLRRQPMSRMVDETTCERISAIWRADGKGPAVGAQSALFRKDDPHKPFMRVETREDGVYVATFPAKQNEVIIGRAYIVDPRTKKIIYGKPLESICVAGRAVVGDLMPVRSDTSLEAGQDTDD